MSATHDVLIVGGGVIGLSVAWELARRGRRVHVLERHEPGSGATRASAGMLAPVSEAETEESDRIRLARDSKRRYPAFIRELEEASGVTCGYRTEGTLWVGVNRDEEEMLEHLLETLKRKGLAATWLEPAELLKREPALSPRAAAGLFVNEDEQLDPRALTRALVTAVTRAGGEVTTGIEITSIEDVSGRVGAVRGRDRDGNGIEFRAAAVVLAAGAWSSAGLRSPLSGLGVRPVKGQMVHLRGDHLPKGSGLSHVIRTPEVYFVPRRDGTLLVGTTMEEQGFYEAPTAGGVLDILRKGWLVYPALYDMTFVEVATGFRPAVRDHSPVIGATGIDGFYVATGHFRGGVLLAPATAFYLAEIMDGKPVPEAIAPFGMDRFAPRAGAAAGRAP